MAISLEEAFHMFYHAMAQEIIQLQQGLVVQHLHQVVTCRGLITLTPE